MNDAILSLSDVRIAHLHGGEELVHGVSLDLRPGQVIGVVGESGSGKTLTCRAILGILPPGLHVSGGRIDIFGEDAAHFGVQEWEQLRGVSITAVFQDPGSYLDPSLRVGPQLAAALRIRRGLRRRQARQHVIDLFADVHLHDPALVYRSYPHELSGGMLQRVLIASAISLEPRILIADEVTTALDVTVQAEILDLLSDLKRSHGLALVVVSHDLAVIAQMADEVLVMRDGRVVEQGPVNRVLFAPEDDYTRLLVEEHESYGLDAFQRPPADADAGTDAGTDVDHTAEVADARVVSGV